MDRREFFKNICTEFDFSDDRESNRCIDVFGVLQDSIDDKVATIICLVINIDNRLVFMEVFSSLKIKREMPVTATPTLKSAFSLGTIVKVRQDADQKYIIIGYATDIVPYAYYAAPWPQGFIDGDSVFLIEPNEISGIVAAGTQNTESVLFLEALDEVMQKETIYDN